ncbi:MAG: error-prone DNA polymerase [Gammaproteobacteria bacterium]|nr:error-prone DNA polymerase [Gammaproteobacteria bacterium]
MAASPDSAGFSGQPLFGFAELHCRSNFSFLTGAAHPEQLVARAAALGYRGIAITDECSLAGVVRAHLAAKDHNLRLIIGTELRLADNGPKLVLLAPHRKAYGQLSALVSRARRRSPKGEYQISLNDFGWGIAQCLALWIPDNDEPFATLLNQGAALKQLLPNLWIALELLQDADDLDIAARALTLAMRLELPLVATNDVLMDAPERKPLQDVLTAIRLGEPVKTLGSALHANRERHLRPLQRLAEIYPPELLTESAAILERCTFSLDELRYEYPEELVPPHLTPARYLRDLTLAGAALRWPAGVPPDVLALIDKELVLVAELAYEYYFLTVHDIVAFARSQNILCQGRGSAANSAVCYCLGITEVDPSRMHLLFERFVSKERNEPPDIDVDFEHERREEVIQYIYKRYGRDRAAIAATLITYRPRSAIRDVGKALGLDLDLVDLLAKSLSWWDERDVLERRCRDAGVDPESCVVQQFLTLVREVLGFPRHLSQHVGGFVISRGPLAELVPIENAAMADRTVIQWDKDDLDALGLLKVDVLGLGMLTAIRKALDLIGDIRGGQLTLGTVPAEDPETYQMLQRGDSVGVFQVESRAQMSMLPRLKPSNFYDLVIEVAIVRPGPIQGNMVHPYLRRRQGLEPVTYSNDAVRAVLQRTLGIPIFQEQVIELAMVAAGFSAGEADRLRRAMAAWKRKGGLGEFEEKLINGMLERGHDRDFAERVFEQIKGFGEYGFPESHAASFALLVYVSAWLKRHEPAAFYCGLLNSLPMGFYSPSQLIQDGDRHGIETRPACVNVSGYDHRLEPNQHPPRTLYPVLHAQPALRLGLRLVKGLGENAARRIEVAQPFRDLEDLTARANLNESELNALARAGTLSELSGHRHQAHWDAAAIKPAAALWKVAQTQETYHRDALLKPPSAGQDMLTDYRYLGVSLGPHPLALLRDHPLLAGHRTAADLTRYRHGQFVKITGLVTCRQRPSSASGVVFLTLEDETGNANIVVWTSILERFRGVLLQAELISIKGTVEREGEVIHVIAGHVSDRSNLLEILAEGSSGSPIVHSRDFR